MKLGIIGSGADKFTEAQIPAVKVIIRDALTSAPGIVLVSGHSPVGGVDIWAEEIAGALGLKMDIKAPKQHRWDAPYGFKERNLDIARSSDMVLVVVAGTYPPGYRGRRFQMCYHCRTDAHVKSGACWTALQAKALGKNATWVVVP